MQNFKFGGATVLAVQLFNKIKKKKKKKKKTKNMKKHVSLYFQNVLDMGLMLITIAIPIYTVLPYCVISVPC